MKGKFIEKNTGYPEDGRDIKDIINDLKGFQFDRTVNKVLEEMRGKKLKQTSMI